MKRVITLVLALTTIAASAQNYSIDWFTIDGGGGPSAGGSYTINGTIGQPDAGPPMIAGNYSLTGGFWSLLHAVPTPGAPRLTIRLTATHTAIISWPSPSPGFVLEQNTALTTSNWSPAPETITDDGTNKFIIVDPPLGNQFYRLRRP